MKHNDRRVIPMFTYEALNGRALPIHGDGRQTRTFCYITDAISGFLKTLLNGKAGDAYNIGNANNEISMTNLGKMYSSVVPGSAVKYVPYPDNYPAGEPQRRCPDLTKAATDLGYASRVDLRTRLTLLLHGLASRTAIRTAYKGGSRTEYSRGAAPSKSARGK
jgi:UDP-glucuronate decarboxylase